MRKTSIERQRGHGVDARFVAALAITGAFAACSGGGEFKSTPAPAKNDPDASLESGAGGATGSGGAGSGGAGPLMGGAANGGTGPGGTAPTDAGKDASEGGLPPPACVHDDDCVPFTCNGKARCVEGVCAPGDPCESPDGGACINECVRTETGASCVSMGRDADGDGHRDAQCAAKPGDDCDDTQPAVYGGAKEVCDGLDNDCNRYADVFDGLPLLSGTTRVVATVTNTAQLALVMRPSGYALLTSEMPDFYAGPGKPADVRFFSFAGDFLKSTRISGSLNMVDPAMAASGEDLVLFGFLNTGTENVLTMTRRLGSDGTIQEPVPFTKGVASGQVWGRAIAALPGGDSIVAWDEFPTAAGSTTYGGLLAARLQAVGGALEPSYIARLQPSASRAYRPHIVVTGQADYGIAWAERQAYSVSDVGIAIHLAQVKRTGPPPGTETTTDTLTDTYRVPSSSAQFQGEAIRPQVAFDGDAYTVAARGPGNTLRVTRVSTSGEVLCGPTPIHEISSWGAAGSLVNTRQGVILIATGSTGNVVVYRVSQGATATPVACMVQSGPVLNAPAKRVASSPTFESGELPASLGDPVLLVGKNDALVAAWVELDRTVAAEPHGVVLRMLGPNLCD